MRPCNGNPNQTWFQNADGKIVLKETIAAISFEGKRLLLKATQYAQAFVIDEANHSISVTRENSGVKLYIGIDASKIFSRLRLFKDGDDNKSINSWYIDHFGPSESPTMTPTHSVRSVSGLFVYTFIYAQRA